MQKVKMTVHEALCEIKIADKKIQKAIQSGTFCTANKASSSKIQGKPIKEFSDSAISSYQKINDLISRTEAIKAALNLSNAATKINVAGKEMTVAEGIYMMQYGMDTKKQLLEQMEYEYTSAINEIQRQNTILEERLDKFITSTFGNKEKANPEDIKVASEVFIKQNTYELVDPLIIKEKIESLRDEIDIFSTQIDSALQISNATTYIEFEY